MKRLFIILSTLSMFLVPAACFAEKVDLVIFAAASLTETLTQIADLYKDSAPDINLIYTFDSSGTLKTQIQEGAECDIFISAAPKQMNLLDISAPETANPDRLDYILNGTRFNLLENKVVLCAAEGNPAGIYSFDDLVKALKAGTVMLAIGNSDVPVGQYTQKIFAYYGLDEAELAANLTYGSNVKEVTTAVVESNAGAGIIYATDAFSAGLTPVDTAAEEMCGQVIYPAAVLKESIHPEEAKAFLEYLKGEEAAAVFESTGFTMLTENKR